MQIKKWHITVSLVCIITGMLLALDLKNYFQSTSPVTRRNQSLVQVIKTQEQKNLELETEIATIRKQLEDVQKTQASGQGFLGSLQKDLETLKFEAGLAPVTGPGIVVTLDDRKDAGSPNESPDDYVIHFSSLLYVVNDLKTAGAEAISVNEVRLVGTSDIRCAGPIITVDGKNLAPPFEIRAIGNPAYLEQAVRNGEYSLLELEKFPVTLKIHQDVEIPAYKGSFTFNYATPVKEGE
ncbi:MAG: DUF881 domain-containing protein [Bacillota bacterium]